MENLKTECSTNTTENQEYYTEEPLQTGIEEPSQTNEENSSDSDAEAEELEKLLETKRKMELAAEEEFKREREQYINDAKNNLKIFETWMTANFNNIHLYTSFVEEFDEKYRAELFGNMCDFFKDTTFVTNEILFYWKYLAISLLKMSKKYKSYLVDLKLDLSSKETNLRFVKEKCTFRCFIGEEPLCYFKENGNDYYMS